MGNARVHSSLAKFAFDCNHKILLHSSQKKKERKKDPLFCFASSSFLKIKVNKQLLGMDHHVKERFEHLPLYLVAYSPAHPAVFDNTIRPE